MNPLQINLKNKNVLLTGASGELGRVMARTLAHCGANIAIHYFKNKERAQDLYNELTLNGTKCCLVQADFNQANEIKSAMDLVQKELGSIQILVLNAVSQYTWKPLLEQDPKDYLDQFNTTVMQAVLVTQQIAPQMITEKYGRIIAINTECTMQCLPTQSAYVAGKRGLDGVMRVLARELGPHNITVNQVAPGWTISQKDREQGTETQNSYSDQVPLRRRGTDQEVAQAVAFLASDLASFTTGATIPVSGGNVMPTV